MNWAIFLTGIASGLLMIVVSLELMRRRALKERYALLWMVLALLLILLCAWPGLLAKLADLLNVYYPPSIIFGLSILVIFAVVMHFSVALSRQRKDYDQIAQRLSIVEEKLWRLNPGNAKGQDTGEEDQDAGEGG